MARNNSLLVFVPVYRLEPETVEAVFSLQWQGPLTHLFSNDNPYCDKRRNMLHQYRRGHRAMMTGDYDAILIIESDVIPPANAARKLDALNADAAYGVYRFRASNVINIYHHTGGRNTGESLTLRPGLLDKAVEAGVTKCSGGGLGCVLVRKHVLNKVEFRLEYGGGGYVDNTFNDDVHAEGFSQMADMTVVCGHKDLDGTVLWPELCMTTPIAQ